MKNVNLKRILSILSITLIIVSLMTSKASCADDKSGSKVLAKIGDKVITEADVIERLGAAPPLYRASLDREEGKRAFVQKMVYIYIFAQEARTEKIDQDKLVRMKIDDMTNSVLAREYLKKKGFTSPEVTKEEVEKFYREHAKEFTKGASVKVSEILVKTDAVATEEQVKVAREKAERITDEAKKGTDFAKLAVKYSDDEKTAKAGGSRGYLTKEQIPPEVARVAFAMKSGDVSNPIKTARGFSIIRVEDKKEGSQESLDEAKNRIVPMLTRQKERDLVEKEKKRLEKKYNVKIFMEDAAKQPAAGKN